MPPAGLDATALLVGVGAYPNERISKLAYAAADALGLATALIETGGFPADRVLTLTDAGADRRAVVRALSRWLPDRAAGAELAVVYFAGHGVLERVGPRAEGYLLPYDADPDDVPAQGVAMRDVTGWIDAVAARAVVVVLDCCHAGLAMRPRQARPFARDLEPAGPAAVPPAAAGRGRFVITSCDDGQVSFEGPEFGGGHGLFTHHLIDGLRGRAGRRPDGGLLVADLFEHVADAVARDARLRGHAQTPWRQATDCGRVYIVPPRPGGAVGESAQEAAWRQLGPAGALALARGRRAAGDEPDAVGWVQLLRRKRRDPAALALLLEYVTHPAAGVFRRARAAVLGAGWDALTHAALRAAGTGDADAVRGVLRGLERFKAHPAVVALLDRLVPALAGDDRLRALQLLEDKRLSLGLGRVAGLFRKQGRPYRLERALGQGLLTGSYLALDESQGRRVVVRVLREDLAARAAVRSAFLDLCRAAAGLVHQNLVLTRLCDRADGELLYYAVCDYIDGVPLRRVLESGQRFRPASAARLMRQLADALSVVHRAGAVHGGVRPSNVFVCEGERAVLGDLSLPGHELGVPLERLAYDYRYAAPEQFRGASRAGPAADLYALGCLGFEALAGRPPFAAEHPVELAMMHRADPVPWGELPEAGDPLADVLRRLLEKDPAGRYPSADAVAEDLDALRAAARAGGGPASGVFPADYRRHARQPSLLPAVADSEPATATGVWVIPEPGPGDEDSVASAAAPAAAPPPRRRVRAEATAAPAVPGYRVGEEVGRGGAGVVYRAVHLASGQVVAIKIVRGGDEELRRCVAEADAMVKLHDCKHVLKVVDCQPFPGGLYLATEFCPGGSLAARVARGGPIPAVEAARLVGAVARGVQAAHAAGIVHRDLKPSNVLLTADGRPRVTDFGVAKHLGGGPDGLTRTGAVVGTPAYMAPEQARDSSRAGVAADVYGLGAVLYAALTGRPPVAGATFMDVMAAHAERRPVPPPRVFRADLPAGLERVALGCLAADPADRYPTADAVADELDRFLAGGAVRGRPPPWLRRLAAWFLPG